MPTVHSYTLTNKDEAALTDAVAAYNAPLLAQTPPGTTLTNDQYIAKFYIDPAIEAMKATAAAAIIGGLQARLNAAAAAGDKSTLNKVSINLTNGGY